MESNINWQARYNDLQEACMKERVALQAKCERYKAALKEIRYVHKSSDSSAAWRLSQAQNIAIQALSVGEGEKGNLPEGWPHACHVCGKQDCESDHK